MSKFETRLRAGIENAVRVYWRTSFAGKGHCLCQAEGFLSGEGQLAGTNLAMLYTKSAGNT